MSDTIKVSVGIPVYNAETYMERCARSLLDQTLGDGELELIFVDDVSTDRSLEILEKVLAEFPGRHPLVKILRQTENQGPMAARQRALQEFRGKYFIFCDADDYVEPDMYESLYRTAEDRSADVVLSGFNVQHVSGKVQKDKNCMDISSVDQLKTAVHCGRLLPSLCCFFFRRNAVDPFCLSLPSFLRYSEDYLMFGQMLMQCRTAASVSRGLYWYFRNNDSLCHKNKHANMRAARYCLRSLDRLDPDPVMVQARQTRWLALLYQDLRYGSMTPRQFHTILRRKGRRVLTDPHLVLKKRLRLALIRLFPPVLGWFRK